MQLRDIAHHFGREVFDARQVADFGEATQWSEQRAAEKQSDGVVIEREVLTMTMVGTKLYVAPEVMKGQKYNKSVDASERDE